MIKYYINYTSFTKHMRPVVKNKIQQQKTLNNIYNLFHRPHNNQKSSLSIHQYFPQLLTNKISDYHQTLKTIHFILKNQKFCPYIRLISNSLLIVEELLDTCYLVIINSIENYILPYLQKQGLQYAKLVKERQTNLSNNSSKQQPQAIKIQIQQKCIQLIYIWSSVKSKQTFQNQVMNENSKFYISLQNIRQKLPQSIQDNLQFNTRQNKNKISQLKKKYYSLMDDGLKYEEYQRFYRFKLFETINLNTTTKTILKSQDIQVVFNKIMRMEIIPISSLPELQIIQLYQNLDPILTTPLNYHIMISFDQFFKDKKQLYSRKKQFFNTQKEIIGVLRKLISYGDIQAYLYVVYSSSFLSVAMKITQVKGEISLKEGANIYPEFGPQFYGRQEFYIAFLKFLEVFGVCVDEDLEKQLQPPRIREIYHTLKKRKFIFPENLMLEKTKQNFLIFMVKKAQRNEIMLRKIRQFPSILTDMFGPPQNGTQISEVVENFNNFVGSCQKQLYLLQKQDNTHKITNIITELKLSVSDLQLQKQIYEDQDIQIKENLNQSLARANKFIKQFRKIQPICDDYLDKKITLKSFKNKINTISLESPPRQYKIPSIKTIKEQSNIYTVKSRESFDDSLSAVDPQETGRFVTKNKTIKRNQISFQKDKSLSRIGDDTFLSESPLNYTNRSFDPKSLKLSRDQQFVTSSFNLNLSKAMKRKTVSRRIQIILNGLKTMVIKQPENSQFKNILSDSILEVNSQIRSPSSEHNNGSKYSKTTFKDCFNIDGQLIQQSTVSKAYQKVHGSSYSSNLESDSLISKNPTIFQDVKQNYKFQVTESDHSVLTNRHPLFKKNPIPKDLIGRLINYQKQIPTMNSQNKSIHQFLKNKQMVSKSNNFQIGLIILGQSKQRRIVGELYITPLLDMKNIKVSQLSFIVKSSIKLGFSKKNIEKFEAKKQYKIDFQGVLRKIQQQKLPQINIQYQNRNEQSESVCIELPITLHNFTHYTPISKSPMMNSNNNNFFISSFLSRPEEKHIFRTQSFRWKWDKMGGNTLEKSIKNLQLLYLDDKKGDKIYGVIVQADGFQFGQSQIYFKLEQPNHTIKDKTMTIYGATISGSLNYLQTLMSIFRYNFSS